MYYHILRALLSDANPANKREETKESVRFGSYGGPPHQSLLALMRQSLWSCHLSCLCLWWLNQVFDLELQNSAEPNGAHPWLGMQSSNYTHCHSVTQTTMTHTQKKKTLAHFTSYQSVGSKCPMKCNVVEPIQGLSIGWLTSGWDAKNTAFILGELMIIMRHLLLLSPPHLISPPPLTNPFSPNM